MFAEMRRILNDRGVFGLIVMAPVLYGVLYPQPYLGQLLRHIPIAVVDQDHTELSRDLVQALNADEAITVAVRADTLADAHAALARREVFAILGIPKDTEREVLKGNKARLAAYVDLAYFLLFNRTLEGISEASGAVTEEIAEHGARTDGSLAHAAVTRASPVELLSQPLFNPTGGYASYVVPAAFILILQQTLFLGIASLGGVAYEQGGRLGGGSGRGRAPSSAKRWRIFASRCRGSLLYLIILPRIYGFSTLGNVARTLLVRGAFRPFGELSRPVRQHVVQAAGDRGRPLHRRQSAAVFHGGRIVAGRGHSGHSPRREPHLSEHVGDPRAGAHQPDGRDAPRRLARLDVALGADRRIRSPGGRGRSAVC